MEGWILVSASFAVGILTVLILRFIFDLPFPWELRWRNPNPKALAACFEKLEDGGRLDLVMGNMNYLVTSDSAPILESALKKEVKIRIINGPLVDQRSEKFFQLLDNPKVELYIYRPRPEPHFRIINQKELYIEEPHKPFVDEGYRYTRSKRLLKEYIYIFNHLLSHSAKANVSDVFYQSLPLL
jgi:hypothetical protein